MCNAADNSSTLSHSSPSPAQPGTSQTVTQPCLTVNSSEKVIPSKIALSEQVENGENINIYYKFCRGIPSQ